MGKPKKLGMSVGTLRATLAEAVNRVAFAKDRILVIRHGKAVAALVPIEDLAILDAFKRAG